MSPFCSKYLIPSRFISVAIGCATKKFNWGGYGEFLQALIHDEMDLPEEMLPSGLLRLLRTRRSVSPARKKSKRG